MAIASLSLSLSRQRAHSCRSRLEVPVLVSFFPSLVASLSSSPCRDKWKEGKRWMEREEEIGTSFGERRSDSKKRDEEKDRYTGHEACAGIYSTAPDLFEGFGRRISRTPVDSFLPEGCSTVDGTAILVTFKREICRYLRVGCVTQHIA